MAADDGVLCHPEILAEEKLIDILSSRGIPRNELLSKDKDALVQLFHRFIVPRPQRTTNMRRANRLRNLYPIIVPVQSTNLEGENKKIGLKRKQPSPGMDEINIASKVTKYLDDTSVLSPTTECTKQITKLIMNCVPAKKAVEPVKLSRNFSTKEHQTKLNSSSSQSTKLNNLPKNDKSRTPVLIKERSPEKSISSDSQVDDSEEERIKSLKKFKRIAVTWP